MAQKSHYTPEVGAAICERLSQGRSLLSICKELGIAYSTAMNWERDNAEHRENSTRAREYGCHALADECTQIADDDGRDWEPIKDADGQIIGVKVDGEHVQRSRLRIDTRMRLIGKWLPKVYGDRTTLAGDPEAPLFEKMTDEQLEKRVAALQAKVNGIKG